MAFATFSIMVPTAQQDRFAVTATFHVTSERDLLDELQARLPSMRKDHALVGVDENALEILLRLSLKGRKP